jgi:hypothetical protein
LAIKELSKVYLLGMKAGGESLATPFITFLSLRERTLANILNRPLTKLVAQNPRKWKHQ